MMVIAEALGHALVVEPYVDTAVVAAGLLPARAVRRPPTPCSRRIAAGDAVVALAAAEAAVRRPLARRRHHGDARR